MPVSAFPFGSIVSVPGETVLGNNGLTEGTAIAITEAQLVAMFTLVLQSELSGYATLVGGVIPQSQLPSIAITEYLGSVVDEINMLLLSGEKGDWCTRSDLGTVWVITGDDPTVLGDWTQLFYPASAVTSVNSATGVVVLGYADVGAAASSHTHTVADLSDATVNSRSLLQATDYAAMRGLLDLEAGTDFYSVTSADSTFAVVGHTHAFSAITSPPTTLAGYGITDAQPVDATLTALASLVTSADEMVYSTALDAFSTTSLTAFARTILDDIDAATVRATIGAGTSSFDGAFSSLSGIPSTVSGYGLSDAYTKTEVDNLVAGLLDLQGSIDCSTNPNYPTANKGDAYYCSVAGLIGGGSGTSVEVGDLIVALLDNAGGTQAAVGTSWFVLEHNVVGALMASNNLSDVASASTALSNIGGQPLSSILTNTTASFTVAQEGKLSGIFPGATANSSDATLLSRANHTDTQLASTISDFSTAVAANAITSLNASTAAAQTISIATEPSGASDIQMLIDIGAGTHTIYIPDAGASARGVVSTGTQTFAGDKTFSGTVSANSVLSANGGLGYSEGSNTTQATSKATTVDVGADLTGRIVMHDATLTAGSSVQFQVTCSSVVATDVVLVQVASTAHFSKYLVRGGNCTAGAFQVILKNDTGGDLGEAVVLRYMVFKGSN